MSDVDLAQFQQLFLTTASDNVAKMESSLVTLESTQSDKNAIETLHLSSHSLKSQSIVMGYQTTGELSHVLELYFRKVKEGVEQVDAEKIAVANEAIQQLKESLNLIKAEGKEINLAEVITNIARSLGVLI